MGATCDVCNAPTSWETGASYSADEFRSLVADGFAPDEAVPLLAVSFGIPRDVAIRQWTEDLVAHSTTGWLLCPSCAARAARVRSGTASRPSAGTAIASVEPQVVGLTAVPLAPPPATPAPAASIVPPPVRVRRDHRMRNALLVAGAAMLVAGGVMLASSGRFGSGATDVPASTVGLGPTASASAAVSPAPSLRQPLRAVTVADWDDAPVTTVCLTGSQAYPQEPDLRLPVNTWARSLLTPLGITITGKDGPCDATLRVVVRIVAIPAKYGEAGVTMYSAGDRDVTVSLAAADRKPIVFEDSVRGTPPELASSSTPRTPHDYLVNQSQVVAYDLLDAAVEIWGPAVAVEALCLPQQEEPYISFAFDAEQRLLDISGLRDELSGAGPVPRDYPSWRRWFETGDVVAGDGGSAGCD